MTFGEKLKNARLAMNLSQSEMAEKSGISERSIYTYEQTGTMPRSGNIRRLAEVLNVSVAKEAAEILSRASALFAGGELDDSAKDMFFRSLMEVYLESKEEAHDKFTPNRSRKKKNKK